MHHLFCGGFEEILPTIGFVDAVISDPPYGITSAKCDVPFNLKRFWQLVETVKRQPGTPTVLFCNQPFTTDLIVSNRAQFKYCWYWVKNNKTNFAVSHKMPLRQLEEIAVFYVPPPPFIIIFTWSSTLRKSKRISALNSSAYTAASQKSSSAKL